MKGKTTVAAVLLFIVSLSPMWVMAENAISLPLLQITFATSCEIQPMKPYILEGVPQRSGKDYEEFFLAFLKPRCGAGALRAVRPGGHSALFVFVHGLHGDHVDTWTNGSTYWPKLVRDDVANFGATDVAVFDYTSPKWRGQGVPGVMDIAVALRKRLGWINAADYDDVVFVVHSLGGVIVRQLLVDLDQGPDPDPRLFGKIRLVLSMAGAYGGSDVAKIFVKLGSGNPEFQDVQRDSQFIVKLNERWEILRKGLDPKNGKRPYVLSAWGDGDAVVTEDSAKLGCDVVPRSDAWGPFPRPLRDPDIDSKGTLVHSDIVKPNSANYISHRLLREAFQLWQSRPSVSPP
jgi:pimeloyl-ACP methyl ester carboxylesterase